MEGSNRTLNVSECFRSIQGEGPTAGAPSVFLRLSGCNLTCGLRDFADIPEKDLQDYEDIKKYREEAAGWVCDTMHKGEGGWLSGHETSLSVVKEEVADFIEEGDHIVITGGEPLLQQSALMAFFRMYFKDVYVEIETNGTITPTPSVSERVDQFNVSPKLSSSAQREEKRKEFQAIDALKLSGNAIFKFVIRDRGDFEEVRREWIHSEMNLDEDDIYLMPAGASREELAETRQVVADICKQSGMSYSPRLHINIWDKMTGV